MTQSVTLSKWILVHVWKPLNLQEQIIAVNETNMCMWIWWMCESSCACLWMWYGALAVRCSSMCATENEDGRTQTLTQNEITDQKQTHTWTHTALVLRTIKTFHPSKQCWPHASRSSPVPDSFPSAFPCATGIPWRRNCAKHQQIREKILSPNDLCVRSLCMSSSYLGHQLWLGSCCGPRGHNVLRADVPAPVGNTQCTKHGLTPRYPRRRPRHACRLCHPPHRRRRLLRQTPLRRASSPPHQ